jgi:ligand-binding sensor domain-containing protein/signal transduction histidine kinase
MRRPSDLVRLRVWGMVYLMIVAIVPGAHAEHYYFRLYTATDGLSQAVVQSIYQDRAGHLWIGTQAGLNRYDGTSITIYGVRQGLANDWINAIVEDSTGRIWLATLSGVSVWDGKLFKNYTIADGLADNRVVSLAIERNNSVWCATSRGLGHYDGQHWRVYTIADGLPADNVNAVLIDDSGRLWVATTGGVAYRQGERFSPFDPRELQGKNIRTLSQDREHQLWLGLDRSLRVYQGDRLVKAFTQADGLTYGPAVALCTDRHGLVWVGAPQGLGVIRESQITLLGIRNGLNFNDVRSLFEDREGILWIGTYGGLYKFQGRAFTNYDTADGLGSNLVRPILRDRKGFLWVGTTGGLSRFDGRTWRNFTFRDGLRDNAVDALLEDRSGNLWIGTRTGLSVFDGTRFIKDIPLAPSGRVMSIIEDHAGTIWCAGMLGALYRRVERRFEPVTVNDQSFSNARLLLDHHGRVWASGDKGLSCWDGRAWRTYTTKDGLASNQPYYLCSDQTGRIWFGYHSSNGLSSFDGTRFAHYTSNEGLSNDAVYSLGADQRNNLWIGTARGVDRFDTQIFTHFGTEEGYANDESNAGGFFADSDGTLWFGTLGGLSHYDPRFDPSSGEAPKVEFTEIRLGRQQFFSADSPRVSHQMNELVARVAGLSFVNARRLSYQYRLQGLNDEWLSLQGQEIRVTNLPSRSYTLEVRARKYQRPWSEPVQFGFTILLPFWMKWWFWLLSASLVVAGLYGGYRIQSARVKHKAAELEKMVEARTRELAQKTEELESFIYTISHDLKAPVVSLQGLASLLQLDLGDRINGDASLYLERIHANTVHMQRLINQLLNLSRIGRLKDQQVAVNMRELTREVINELHGQIELAKATIHIGDDLPVLTCEQDRFKQVMINLISNAIHYSRPDVPPVIEIGVKKDNGERDFCTLFVHDNGIGIAKEYHDRVFDIFYRVDGKYTDSESTGVGLAIVKRVISAHGGNVWVESEGVGSGSTFYFSLPRERMQEL